ncbi:MAG: hypothetical protein Q8M44_05270 [bacterium]|nr:hypothetical protein [bacterium]
MIEVCKSGAMELVFLRVSLSVNTIQKSLSFNSRIIFSAIFLPIHFIHSIVLLSSHLIANNNLSIHRDNICIATFHHTPDIFISSEKTFFSSGSMNQKSDW